MRDVTPKDPESVARMMSAEDGILRYIEGKFRDLRRDTFDLMAEVGKGYWNSTVKELDRKEKLIAELRGNLEDIKSALRERGITIKVKPLGRKEEEKGRPAFNLGRTARVTLTNHAAEAA